MHKQCRCLPAIVYLVTNKVNGKRYIGVTTRALRRRMAEHFTRAKAGKSNGAFDRAIRKYGRHAFEFSVLADCATGIDGLQMEILLIAQLRPEYNSTAGGDGAVSREMSDAGRTRLSDFHTGKQWHLGHSHSAETKEIVRAAQFRPEIVSAWVERAKLGPQSMARRVICLDDGCSYLSASAAAREYGVSKSALIELCLGKNYRKTVGGRRFIYEEVA